MPEVEARDIGGAFGCKAGFSREEIAVTAAAIELGRSVKWIEDRNEHLAVGGQARDERMRVSAAVNDDGELLALPRRRSPSSTVPTRRRRRRRRCSRCSCG